MSITAIAQDATTNFENTPINQTVLVPIGLASMGLAIVVVFLRLGTRHFLTRRLWWDDAIIFAALFPSVGLSVDGYYGPRYGWGHHAQDIPSLEYYVVGFLKTLWISSLCFTLASGWIKCSVLVFYLRITAGGAHQTLRRVTWAALVITTAWTIIMLILVCVQCIPTSMFWSFEEYAIRNAACVSWAAKRPFYLGQGTANVVGDFVVVLLPVKYILRLKLPKVQKVILLVLICLGLLATVSGILRLVYIVRVFETPDTTWEGIMTLELACLEMNTSIICASIPAIKPLVVSLFPRFDRRSHKPSMDEVSNPASWTTTEDAEGKIRVSLSQGSPV